MRTFHKFCAGLLALVAPAATVTTAQVPGPQQAPRIQQPAPGAFGATSRTNQFATEQMQINWRSDLAKARQDAQQSGKPLLLHFYTTPCIYCEKLEKGAFRDPLVIAEIEEKFVPLRIFAPDNTDAAEALQVDRFPTDVIVEAGDGTVLMRTVSPQDPFAFVSMLATAMEQRSALPDQMRAKSRNSQPAGNAAISPPLTAQERGPAGASVNAKLTSSTNQFASELVASEFQQHSPIQQHSLGKQQSSVEQRSPEPRSLAGASSVAESVEPIMEGYCLVTMAAEWQWTMGDPNIAAMHLGRLYWFASEDARRAFLHDPNRYAPVMNGLDVVKFFDEGKIVEGVRGIGCATRDPNRIFFFSSEASAAKFEASEQSQAYYTSRAIELARRAAADANNNR